MISKKLMITAPALNCGSMSEAEVLGCITWLLLQCHRYQAMPLSDISRLILPIIKQQQYILATNFVNEQVQPTAFISWANFDAATEARYLSDPVQTLTSQQRNSGDRMWILDLVAPFGQVAEFTREIRLLLADSCMRTLYHRGHERSMRVMHMRGCHISLQQAKQWWVKRPLPNATSATPYLSHSI